MQFYERGEFLAVFSQHKKSEHSPELMPIDANAAKRIF